MRITGLEIYNYGKFSNAKFKIDPKLHVFVGPNESGKTTLFDFVTQVLFGFASHRYPEKRHENPGSIHGGKIFLQDPVHGHGFVERVGQKKVRGDVRFSFEDGYGGGEEEWAVYSRNFSVEAYENLFALDLDNLEKSRRQEDRDLESLFLENGLLGNHRLNEIQTQLREEADLLYLEKSYARPLDKKIQELEDIEKQVQKAKAHHQDYLGLQAQKEKWAGQQLANDEAYVRLKKKAETLAKLLDHESSVQKYLTNKDQAGVLPDSLWPRYQQLDKEEGLKSQALDRALTSQSDLLLNEESKMDQWRHSNPDQLEKIFDWEEKLGHLEEDYHALHYEVLQTGNYIKKQTAAMGLGSSNVSLLSKEDLEEARDAAKRSQEQPKAWPFIISLGFALILGALSEPLFGVLVFIILGGGYFLWSKANGNTEELSQTWQSLLADHELPVTWSVQDYENRKSGLEHLLETKESYGQALDREEALLEKVGEALGEVHELDFPYTRKEDPIEDLHSFREASRNLHLAQQRESKKDIRLKDIAQEIRILEKDLQALKQEKQELLNHHGFTNAQDLLVAAQNKDQVTSFREKFFNELDTIHSLDRSKSIEAQLREVEAEIKDLEALRLDQSQLGLDIAQDIQAIEEGSAYASLLQDQADKESEVQALKEDWLVKKVAVQLIEKAFEEESHESLQKLLSRASTYLKIMTQNAYDEITYHEETFEVRGPKGAYPLQVLSKGTQDQVYISMKLAFILIKAADYPFPVLLDDPFVNFDFQRQAGFQALIKKLSEDKQFIIFTMDKAGWNSASDETLVML